MTPAPPDRKPIAHPALLWGQNGEAIHLARVPEVGAADLRRLACEVCAAGGRLIGLALLPAGHGAAGRRHDDLLVTMADDAGRVVGLLRAAVPEDGRYPALSAELPQAQAFERDLHERHGVLPEGHPWLKPLRRHADLEAPSDPDAPSPGARVTAPGHAFFQVEGEGVHEVAVGPVHAGIIEPGHFRFQCHGESVLHLEIQLGYQHRGAEELLLTAPPARRLAVAESIAGDTVIGHATAYSMVIEALAGVAVPPRAALLRAVALEIERCANHVGDLGALCNDVGYLPGAAWLGRLRGEFLNLLLDLSGNRYGRGLAIPGGVRFDLDDEQRTRFLDRLDRAGRDLREIAGVVFSTSSVESRFEGTGRVDRRTADDLGLVGPVARASGCDRDARRDHPSGPYRAEPIPVVVLDGGDVMARARIRHLEAEHSLAFATATLRTADPGAIMAEPGTNGAGRGPIAALPCAPGRVAVSITEGWRGEIVHFAVTSAEGRITVYRVVDPSLHNWFGLAIALRGNEISDFPLCNKSFSLSYAGHDL